MFDLNISTLTLKRGRNRIPGFLSVFSVSSSFTETCLYEAWRLFLPLRVDFTVNHPQEIILCSFDLIRIRITVTDGRYRPWMRWRSVRWRSIRWRSVGACPSESMAFNRAIKRISVQVPRSAQSDLKRTTSVKEEQKDTEIVSPPNVP